ncbi:S10 family peptidase [Leptolyngbya ohadii]|uniref:S10 family peptidase n=1 Tax=Leptolyngbya ohadii TaxID=1962290 RepID=UPI000B5A0B14|nr:peptidase S10 [Leptolyngbya ohadii]
MSEPSNSTANSTRKTSVTEHTLSLPDRQIPYTASAGWLTLFDKDKPIADLFHVAYLVKEGAEDPANRPLTFVFNGGPGAASAYLHMGALGPKRILFGENGTLPKPPVRLGDNLESWLPFTDLVFIDPVGTGFSRASQGNGAADKASSSDAESKSDDKGAAKDSEASKEKEAEFWEVERDLKALGEFIQRFLSKHKRWLSPVFIAGESYGGFRVAKLARILQQEFGVGLSGAILISPALEFNLLLGLTDYDLTSWITLLPSYAASAAHHDRAQWAGQRGDMQAHLSAAEQFARRTYLSLLVLGDAMPLEERQAAYEQMAKLIGLPTDLVTQKAGRLGIEVFSRELLRDRQRIVGLYDASIVAIDPFPDRTNFEGTDPTLDGLDRLFTGAINSHLRDTLGVETDLVYNLLSYEVFKAWKFDMNGQLKQGFIGSIDDLRIGMTLNPYMQVYVTHGLFDLVTPYFASNHLADLMKLDPEVRPNLTLKHYEGGHMFYTWERSRKSWYAEMQAFYQKAIE